MLHDPALFGPTSKHNLPSCLTSFIGREDELSEVPKLLGDHRLVTLTGVGGSGKSRLAFEVVAGVVKDFPDGCWVAELAEISDPSLVPGEVATAIGLRPHAEDAVDVLLGAITDETMLIVLVNCERTLQAEASLTQRLLEAGSGVKVPDNGR